MPYHHVVATFTNIDDAVAFFEYAASFGTPTPSTFPFSGTLDGCTVTVQCFYFPNLLRVLGYLNEDNIVSITTTRCE